MVGRAIKMCFQAILTVWCFWEIPQTNRCTVIRGTGAFRHHGDLISGLPPDTHRTSQCNMLPRGLRGMSSGVCRGRKNTPVLSKPPTIHREQFCNINDTLKRVIRIPVNRHISTGNLPRLTRLARSQLDAECQFTGIPMTRYKLSFMLEIFSYVWIVKSCDRSEQKQDSCYFDTPCSSLLN